MAKIILTGCAGFVGNKVGQKLLEAGNDILGIDNMNDYYDPRLKEWRLGKLKPYKNFCFYNKDIANYSEMEKIFESFNPEIVVNLAARAGVRACVKDPWVYLETNTKGTLNLLECSRRIGVNKFLLASTSSIYGLNQIPFSESDHSSSPLTTYGATKKGAEAQCFVHHYLYGIDVVIPRYFTVYGPAGRPDMSIYIFIKNIMAGNPIKVFGDGKQKRDFTYIDDIADGTVKALELIGYHIVNLGSDNPVELMYIINLIEEYTGKKAKIEFLPRNPVDVPATWANISKAREMLKWKSKVKIEEGVKKTVEWFKENEALVRSIDPCEQ